jgi:transcriptional regulator with XRE-family HTH domain
MNLGERIKQFRKEHLLSTREAGKIFGVSQSEIARLESGKNQPNIITEAKWEKMIDEAEQELAK